MDAVKAFMERSRMCKSHYGCEDCPLNGKCGSCVDSLKDAKEALDIVEKWSKEHPVKTNLDRFKEVFPGSIEKMSTTPSGVFVTQEWWDAEYKEGEK